MATASVKRSISDYFENLELLLGSPRESLYEETSPASLAGSIFKLKLTWDQALFSFLFVNNISAGKAKWKESLIQTFWETSAAHFFDRLTFAKWANQNYFRCMLFLVCKFFIHGKMQKIAFILFSTKNKTASPVKLFNFLQD